MRTSVTRDVNIESTAPLIAPIELVNKLAVTPRVERIVASGREQTRKILNGEDARLMVIVGPCSIHDERAALDYAARLLDCSKRLCDRLLIVMRVYFEKPRTTTGWKGLIPTFPIWLNIPLSKSSAFFKPLSICETLAVGMAIITP